MTNLGRAKEAAALANGTAIVITHIAIGDGTTVPSGGEAALYNEVARKAISGHGTVSGASNVAYFDIFLAANDGPYTIREAGLYDNAGDLIAIARYDPPISKPVPASGQTVEGTVRLQVAFSNVANITIVVDPSFMVPLQRLSRLPWIPVLSMTILSPPASPALGDTYLVPVGATGAWSGQSGKIAEYTAAGWGIISTSNGHGVSLPDGRIFEKIDGTYIEKLAMDVQSGKWNYSVTTGNPTTLVANLSPPLTAHLTGMRLIISAPNGILNGPTLNAGPGALPLVRQDGIPLRRGDIPAGVPVEVICTGSVWVLAGIAYSEVRRKLNNNITVFVRSDGNDANDGSANTAAAAFKTIQAALEYVSRNYDTLGYQTSVQVGIAGTYAGAIVPPNVGTVVIVGSSASAAYEVTTPAGAVAPFVVSGGTVNIKGFNLKATASLSQPSACVQCQGGVAIVEDCYYGANIQSPLHDHILVGTGGRVILAGFAQIQQSARSFVLSGGGGSFGTSGSVPAKIYLQSSAYSGGFCMATSGYAEWNNVEFLGAATGPRFNVSANGTIQTFGGGNNFLPGNAAGVVNSGGAYV